MLLFKLIYCAMDIDNEWRPTPEANVDITTEISITPFGHYHPDAVSTK